MYNYPNNPNQFNPVSPYYNAIQQQLSQQPIFTATVVSNIAEVNSTPADATGKPSFFYNKSKEEIYIKQYDNTGSAPIRTYKLAKDEKQEKSENLELKELVSKIDKLNNLLSQKTIEVQKVGKNAK